MLLSLIPILFHPVVQSFSVLESSTTAQLFPIHLVYMITHDNPTRAAATCVPVFFLSLLDFLHTLDATTFNSCPLSDFLNTFPLMNSDLTISDSGLEAQGIEVARFFLFLAARQHFHGS